MDLRPLRFEVVDLVTAQRPIRRAAFTLLEAVLALAILSSVLVVCLTVRAQSIAQRARLSERLDGAQDCEAVFESIIGGVLPATRSDPETGARVWEGERSGRPYSVVATREVRPSPIVGTEQDERAAFVTVWRYTVTVGANESATKRDFLWHR